MQCPKNVGSWLKSFVVLFLPVVLINKSDWACWQVKLQYLHYLYQLVQQMEMSEFINNTDTKCAVAKIISWVEEPKSAEVRSAAKTVVGSMFNLNPPELNSLLSGLERPLQVRKTVNSYIFLAMA